MLTKRPQPKLFSAVELFKAATAKNNLWLWHFLKPPQPKKTFGCGNLISPNHSLDVTVNSQSDTVYSSGTEVLYH